MNHRPLSNATLAALCLLTAVGCQTVSPGVTNRVGTIDAMMEHDPDVIISAAESTMNELGVEVVSSEAGKLDGALEARTARDYTIHVRAERVDPSYSVVSIRYGRLGDQDKSLMILDSIKRHAASPSTQASTADSDTQAADPQPAADDQPLQPATVSAEPDAATGEIE